MAIYSNGRTLPGVYLPTAPGWYVYRDNNKMRIRHLDEPAITKVRKLAAKLDCYWHGPISCNHK